ncbi:nickel pincer cofactor biosynthesis protein LarC [Streptomyces lavendofoliae]|uniref:nickel pincer cofactor biosynthesis protein LarC n=1 Tax=Streptomyces lavendofoliae TaxID=67314 RepID=UPI003D8B0BE8
MTAPTHAVAHVDCTAGVAGDMLLGALIDAGARTEAVREGVRSLGVAGLDISVERARRGGFACARVHVTRPPVPDRARHLPDILDHLTAATGLGRAAVAFATRVFELLARAEATAHGTTPDQVHFHEVGAYDALADAVGCAAALDDLGLLAPDAAVTCSALAAGSGSVDCAHGRVPVPVPAVLHIAAETGLPLTGGDLAGERTTPTGAALLGALAVPRPAQPMTVRAVGVGGGRRDTPDRPNVTRVVIGQTSAEEARPGHDEVLVVESTVDDLDPRLWPSVLSALRAAGAWDCWTSEIVARHGRPGRLVTALCPGPLRDAVADALFRHTTTLGVRWSVHQRLVLPRHSVAVSVGPPDGGHSVQVKVAERPDGTLSCQPELSDAERAAVALGWPVRTVCEAAAASWRESRIAGPPPPRSSADDLAASPSAEGPVL